MHQVQDCNQTHDYFIGVLEQVYGMFKPLHKRQFAAQRPKQHSQATDSIQRNSASPNTFGALLAQTEKLNISQNSGVSDPDDVFANQGELNHQDESVRKLQVSLEEPVVGEGEEEFFAVHCLLIDLHNLRAFNRETWQSYVKGTTTLMVASVTTNTIVDFAARMIHDFWKQIGKQETYARTLVDFFMHRANVNRNSSDAKSTAAEHMPADPADFIFFPAWSHIQVFFVRLAGMKSPDRVSEDDARQTGHRQTDQSPREADALTKAAASDSLMNLLNWKPHLNLPQAGTNVAQDVLTGLQLTDSLYVQEKYMTLLNTAFGKALDVPSRAYCRHPNFEDEILRWLRCSFLSGSIELTVCFAVQLFFDIHELQQTGGEAQGLVILDARLKPLSLKANLHLAYWRKIGFWWNSVPDPLEVSHPMVWHEIAKQTCDHVLNNTACHNSKANEVQDDVRGLLACSPVARGVHDFCLTLASAKACSLEADGLGLVLSVLHFYNACSQCGATTSEWRDFDYLLDVYGAEYLFMGGLPETLQACALKFRLVLGESLQFKSKDVVMCRASLVKNKRPFDSRATPLARCLWARMYGGSRTSPQAMLDDAEFILAELHKKGNGHRIKSDVYGQIENFLDLRRRNKDAPCTSHTQFLAALKDRVSLEVSHLEFDFFALTRRCINMLTAMIDELEVAGFDVQNLGQVQYRGKRSARVDAKMDSVVIAETFIRYAGKKEIQGLCGTKEMPWQVEPPGYEQAEERFEAVVRGMEKCLLKMKKDGVKDLCEVTGWTGPLEWNGNDSAAANHKESMNGSKETSGSAT